MVYDDCAVIYKKAINLSPKKKHNTY